MTPTLHASFAELVEYALRIGLKVEVFSNLVHVKPEWWKLFQRPGVSIATSYYAQDAAEHNRITARDSHRKTRANIARAIQLDIPLRVGIISVSSTQSVAEAQADLSALGVVQIGTDRMRHFGRGQHGYPIERWDRAVWDVRLRPGRGRSGRGGDAVRYVLVAHRG